MLGKDTEEHITLLKKEFIEVAIKAGKIVARKTLDDYFERKRKESLKCIPAKTAKTMLREYRIMKKAQKAKDFLPTQCEATEMYWKFLEELMGKPDEKIITEDVAYTISKKHIYNSYKIWRIENAVKFFKEECEEIGSKEALRRARVLKMMYIGNDRKTIKDIAKIEKVSEKTVYKDIELSCESIARYLASL